MNGFVTYFTRILDYAHFFQILTIAFAVVFVLSPIKHGGNSVVFAAVKVLTVCAVCIIVESFLFFLTTLIGGFVNGIIFPVTYLTVILLYTCFFCKYEIKLKIISASLLFASVVMVTECIKNFAFLLPANGTVIAVAVIFISLLNLLTVFVFTKYNLKRFISIPKTPVVLIMLVSVTAFITEFVYSGLLTNLFRGYQKVTLVYTAISGTVLYIFILAFYLMFYSVLEGNARIAQLQLQEKLMRTDADMMNVMQATMSDIRRMRHESQNRYAYMRILLDNGQYGELSAYLDSVAAEIVKPLPYVDCSNRTVANVLNLEKSKASANGIEMTAELNVPPVLPFDDVMLCSVFTNLIDNAIEACKRYSIAGEVKVTATVRGEYFYIVVTNPLPENADKEKLLEMNTVKENPIEHGYGKQIVRKVTETYDGMCSYSVEDGVFIAEIMLSLITGGV